MKANVVVNSVPEVGVIDNAPGVGEETVVNVTDIALAADESPIKEQLKAKVTCPRFGKLFGPKATFVRNVFGLHEARAADGSYLNTAEVSELLPMTSAALPVLQTQNAEEVELNVTDAYNAKGLDVTINLDSGVWKLITGADSAMTVTVTDALATRLLLPVTVSTNAEVTTLSEPVDNDNEDLAAVEALKLNPQTSL
jgi:hypothetical protein